MRRSGIQILASRLAAALVEIAGDAERVGAGRQRELERAVGAGGGDRVGLADDLDADVGDRLAGVGVLDHAADAGGQLLGLAAIACAEDDERRAHDEIQKMTDSYMQKLDQAASSKEKEIVEIK